jgi:F-type H+-transporting ATPase subunit b
MSRYHLPALGFVALALALAIGPLARAARPAEPAHAAAKGGQAAPSPSAEAEHVAAEGEPNILEVQPSLALWTVVVFVGLLLVLARFAWKPLLNALHQREEHLEHVLHDTERARNEAESLLAEHRRTMAEAQEKVRAMLDEARREAQAASDEIARKAQAEAEAARQRAERDIASARDRALLEIWSKSAEMAVAVAGKVLDRQIGPDEHRRLIEAAINELPESPAGRNGQGGART